jgi:hypothetical protein
MIGTDAGILSSFAEQVLANKARLLAGTLPHGHGLLSLRKKIRLLSIRTVSPHESTRAIHLARPAALDSSQRSPKKPALTIRPGQRDEGGTRISTTA